MNGFKKVYFHHKVTKVTKNIQLSSKFIAPCGHAEGEC